MTGVVYDNVLCTTMRSSDGKKAYLGCVTRVADTWLLDLLALEARPLESFVIAAVLSFWTLGVFDRRVQFSPGTVSAF